MWSGSNRTRLLRVISPFIVSMSVPIRGNRFPGFVLMRLSGVPNWREARQ